MDSDGWGTGREKSQSVYVSTIRQLAESVRELLWSLGIKNAMTVGPSLRYGKGAVYGSQETRFNLSNT